MRAIPYTQLGFSSTQSGFVNTWEGSTTVQVVAPLVQPSGPPETIAGLRYDIDRYIVWVDSATDKVNFPLAYKRVAVLVRWTDKGQSHVARQDGYVYPGGLGAYTGPAVTSTTTSTTTVAPAAPPAPTSLTATATGTTTVALSWVAGLALTPAVSTWVVQYSTDNFVNTHLLTDTQPAAAIAYSVSGLSPGTTYQFRVAAKGATGLLSAWSPTATVTSTAAAAAAAAKCQLGTSTITPSAVTRYSATSTLLGISPLVSVNTTGPCSGLRLTYAPTSTTTGTASLSNIAGGLWLGTVDGVNTAWDTGSHQLTVLDVNNVTLGTLTLAICAQTARTCP
jgi:hypothetical protein